MSKNPSKKDKGVIICGTDFTPAASHAADAAAAISRKMGTPLELVHAEVLLSFHPMKDALKSEAERLRGQRTDVHECLVEGKGIADEELVSLAKGKPCELIVVSSHGHRAPKRWLLGSTAERTAERAGAPTLVVRSSGPFLEWTGGERPLHVFIAFNQTRTSEAALRWAMELQELGPCEITVGYTYYLPEQRAKLGFSGAVPVDGDGPGLQSILERNLRESAAKILGKSEFKTSVRPYRNHPENMLADMAGKSAADLLVIGSHQRHGFERVWVKSISRGVLHSAKMNVAVVPLAASGSKRASLPPAIKKVLVTTDFSELANQSIPHAYSLLGGGGQVQLLHIMHPLALGDGEYLQGSRNPRFRELHAKLERTYQERLGKCVPADAGKTGIRTTCKVAEHDNPAAGINEAAERFGADAICIGTHGCSGLVSTVFGSTSMALLHLSRKPVYLVRSQEE